MCTKRSIFFALMAVAILAGQMPGEARAEDAAPGITALLQDAYGAYAKPPKSPDAMATPARIRKLFSPRLAALILRVQRLDARTHDENCIETDPLIDAQDWDAFGDLQITSTMSGQHSAKATASFVSLGDKKTVYFEVVQPAASWQIDDISTGRGDSFRQTLQSCLAKKH